MNNKDKETDFCYYCGHQLGEHRASGKCDKVIADPKLADFRFVVCGCRHYQIKIKEEEEEEEEK